LSQYTQLAIFMSDLLAYGVNGHGNVNGLTNGYPSKFAASKRSALGA
jgi:hypothetical protein